MTFGGRAKAHADTRAGIGIWRLSLLLFACLLLGCSWMTKVQAQDKGATNKPISIAYCTDCVPFQFTNDEGRAEGIIIDYWRLWQQKTGRSISFQPYTWNDSLEAVRDGDADVHAGLFYRPERDQFLDYGVSLIKTATHVFFSKEIALPASPAGIAAHRIAVLRGDAVEATLKEQYPDAPIIPYDSYADIIDALKTGVIKVFASDTPTGLFHLAQNNILHRFHYSISEPVYENDWFVAAGEGAARMLADLKTGYDQISPTERKQISRRWADGNPAEQGSDAVIIALFSDYPPFSFLGIDGKPRGFLVDFWREWGRVVGRDVVFRATDWPETLAGIDRGSSDVHSGLFRNDERATWLDFSAPIFEVNSTLFVRSGSGVPSRLPALDGYRLGVLEGSYQQGFIKARYPAVQQVPFVNSESMIAALLRGNVDALVHEGPSVDALLSRFGMEHLIEKGDVLFSNYLQAGTVKSDPDMGRLVTQGLAAMKRSDIVAFERHWFSDAREKFYERAAGQVRLSPEELDWITANPEVEIAVSDFIEPIDILNKQTGIYRGFNADLIAHLNRHLPLTITPRFYNQWDAVVEAVSTGATPMGFSLSKTPEREKHIAFTRPYAYDETIFVVRNDRNDLRGWGNLTGKRVSVNSGTALADSISSYLHNTDIVRVTGNEGINMVLDGSVDAHIDALVLFNNRLKEQSGENLRIGGSLNLEGGALRIGVQQSQPVLANLMKKALAAISESELSALREKWLVPAGLRRKFLVLDEAEQKFVEENPRLIVGVDPAWPPFEYLDDDGQLAGLSAGYVTAVADRIGLDLVPPARQSWQEVMEKARAGELDLLAAVARTPDREEYLSFSEPWFTSPFVITARRGGGIVTNLIDLQGQKVGVVQGYSIHETLERNYPELDLVPQLDIATGLKAVSSGELDAFVANLGVTSYVIERDNLTNLRIAAPTEYELELSMAVPKGKEALLALVQRALNDLSDSEVVDIRTTWLKGKASNQIDSELLLIWGGSVAALILGIIMIFSFWNRRLSREVLNRKDIEQRLRLREERFRALMEATPDAMLVIDMDGIVRSFNQQAEALFGYDRSEVLGLSVDIFVPEGIRRGHSKLRGSYAQNPQTRRMGGQDLLAVRKDGSEVNVEIGLSPLNSVDGMQVIASVRDVTQTRKDQADMKTNLEELRSFHSFAVNRELRMIELKDEINELRRALGKEEKYETVD